MFEKVIQEKGVLVYTNVGTSMMPLLRQRRDLIVIERPKGRLKRYDVPLYKRDDGKYILHRVLWVRKNDYLICGDNQCHIESGITDRHVIGVLTSIRRGNRTISVTDWRYRLYVHIWCDLFPLRWILFTIRRVYRAIIRRIHLRSAM